MFISTGIRIPHKISNDRSTTLRIRSGSLPPPPPPLSSLNRYETRTTVQLFAALFNDDNYARKSIEKLGGESESPSPSMLRRVLRMRY